MSDNLISRKAVMDYLQEQQANVIIEQNKNNPVTHDATNGMLASVDAFMNFIIQAPIAYDLDKVVKRIVDDAITALEKQIPYKPTSNVKFGIGKCKCGVEFLDKDTAYCGNFGQKLDWEGKDE